MRIAKQMHLTVNIGHFYGVQLYYIFAIPNFKSELDVYNFIQLLGYIICDYS